MKCIKRRPSGIQFAERLHKVLPEEVAVILINIISRKEGLHSGKVDSNVALQKEGPVSNIDLGS